MSLTPSASKANGAKDGDPIAILVLIFMIIIALLWLSNPTFTPWQGNFGCSGTSTPSSCHVTIASGFSNAYTILAGDGFLTIFVPLGIVMFLFFLYKEFTGESPEDSYRIRVLREDPNSVYRRPRRGEVSRERRDNSEESDEAEEDWTY